MQFASVLGQDDLLIDSLEGVEGMSRLFDFQVELLVEAGETVNPVALVGTKATIAIKTVDSDDPRYINGLIAAFEQTSGDENFDNYRAHIVPSMWQLTLTSGCRVFQNQTPMDIIKKVLKQYSLSLKDQTDGGAPSLDYCTQYNESDFAFVSRIAEKYGIYYWFDHENGDHTVVFGNSTTGYDPDPVKVEYAAQGQNSEQLYRALVTDIRATAVMVSGKYSYRDYDVSARQAMEVGPELSKQVAGKNMFEVYAYPAEGNAAIKQLGDIPEVKTKSKTGDVLIAERDAGDVGFNTFHGSMTARNFYPGGLFTLGSHPRGDWNRDYLLTEVIHHVRQSPGYLSNEHEANPYAGRFTAIESNRLFRPVARTPKPVIAGPQSALVVTPSGEDLYVDKLGRVCVQFLWDRERKPDTLDNTWVRVAQPWAGSGWGSYFWPRKNDEVLIQFMSGDPDAPVVIGSVYNGVNVPKYALPDMSTRSGFLTRSVKEGGASNANELRFEDKKGSEQIFLNAEMDMDHRIENDLRTYVMGQESRIVDKDQLEQVGGNYNRSIKGDAVESTTGKQDVQITGNVSHKYNANYGREVSGDVLEKIDGKLGVKVTGAVAQQYDDSMSLKIAQNLGEKVGMNYALDAGMEAYIKGGMSVTIEAGLELTLKAAGGFITIGPAGVAISGTMVLINSGGAAGSGSPPTITEPDAPTAPTAPKDPDKADDGTKGGKM